MGFFHMRPIRWEDRLAEYIELKRHTPFKWGNNDCVVFAINTLDFIFNSNLIHQIPTWTNEKEAAYCISLLGKDLKEAANLALPQLGFIQKPITHAARGDLVITQSLLGPMFTICIGSKLIAPGRFGIEFLPVEGQCWEYRGVE
jgi:hypothetical protein